MSETFEKVLVKDDRLGCITSKVKYQVFKGGQNITCTPFMAQSQSTSTHVYNIPAPSLETIISREVLWKKHSHLQDLDSKQTGIRIRCQLRCYRCVGTLSAPQLGEYHAGDHQ